MRMSRRSLLAGLTGLGATSVLAADRPRQRLVVVLANGGWDPTFVMDPKLGVEGVDGPELDQTGPADLEVATTLHGIPLVINETKRPSVSRFFEAWGDRVTVVNGLMVGAIGHEQGLTRILTGTDAAGSPDLVTAAGQTLGADLPLAAIDLAGHGRFAALGASVARLGHAGQLSALADQGRRDWRGPLPQAPKAAELDRLLDTFAARRAEQLRQSRGALLGVSNRLDDFQEALDRAAALRDGGLGRVQGAMDGQSLMRDAEQVASLLRSNTTAAVLVDSGQTWDLHADVSRQHASFEGLFAALLHLLDQLTVDGTDSSTTVVVLSELGRTPRRNQQGGKDHWPCTSALVVHPDARGGRVVGGTDLGLAPLSIDLRTGELAQGGTVPGHDHFVAGVLADVGVDPGRWLPGVMPLGFGQR
jgi:hypothetical protein